MLRGDSSCIKQQSSIYLIQLWEQVGECGTPDCRRRFAIKKDGRTYVLGSILPQLRQ